jgi:hypothetical protein
VLKTKTPQNAINDSQARKNFSARIARSFWFDLLFLGKKVEDAALPQWIEGDLWERLGKAAFVFDALKQPGQYQCWI